MNDITNQAGSTSDDADMVASDLGIGNLYASMDSKLSLYSSLNASNGKINVAKQRDLYLQLTGNTGNGLISPETFKQYRNVIIGVGLMLISGVMYAFLAVFFKILADLGFSTEEILIYRSSQQILLCCMAGVFTRIKTKKTIFYGLDNKKIIVAVLGRGIFGAIGVYGYIHSCELIPVGDTLTLKGLCPIFTSFVGYLVFKDLITKKHFIALLLGISATILVTQPPLIFGSSSIAKDLTVKDEIGYLFALISALAQCVTFICIKFAKAVSPTILILCQGVFTLLLGFTLLYAVKGGHWNDISSVRNILAVLGLGIIGYIAQFTLTKGGQLLISGFASLLRTTDIMWSFALQVVFWDLIPDLLTIIGALLMLSGIGLVSYEKIQNAKRKQKPKLSINS